MLSSPGVSLRRGFYLSSRSLSTWTHQLRNRFNPDDFHHRCINPVIYLRYTSSWSGKEKKDLPRGEVEPLPSTRPRRSEYPREQRQKEAQLQAEAIEAQNEADLARLKEKEGKGAKSFLERLGPWFGWALTTWIIYVSYKGYQSQDWLPVEARIEQMTGVKNDYVAFGAIKYSYRDPFLTLDTTAPDGALLSAPPPAPSPDSPAVGDNAAERLPGFVYATGSPFRGFSLMRWDTDSFKKGGTITVYYNPTDRRESTLVRGVPFPLVNALALLFGAAVFFLPLLPNRKLPKMGSGFANYRE